MNGMAIQQRLGLAIALGVTVAASVGPLSAAPTQLTCKQIVMTGEVNAGQEWKASIGQGWVFRVMPIDPAKTPTGQPDLSGWDLVVDRAQGAGFPDALLLATPPYDSINEREIGTTFGLRSQDAIGWNPRSFRFLVSPQALLESQKLFLLLHRKPSDPSYASALHRMMELTSRSSAGQFRIVDARLTPGIADAAPFAENWALRSALTPHTVQPTSGALATPLGSLNWIRFTITLRLPGMWTTPNQFHAVPAACSE